MINLFEMMQKAQGGHAVDDLARQFGLSPQQAESAVDALLPAFTIALRRQLRNPQSWPYLMAALSIPPGPAQGVQPFSPQAVQQGGEMLGALFGSRELGQQVANQAASVTGMNATMLQQMMPAMASMLMGGAMKTFGPMMETFQRNMGLPGTTQASASPAGVDMPMGIPENWGEILGELMAGRPEPKPEPEPASEPEEEPANPFDPAGFGAMFARMLSGQSGEAPPATPMPEMTPAAPVGEPAPGEPAPTAPDGAPQPAAADLETQDTGGPAGLEAFNRLVETGREVQEQHMRNLQKVMGKVWGTEDGPA